MLPLPKDTRLALGLAETDRAASASKFCRSRSLLLERYANPELKEEDRRNFFLGAIGGEVCRERARMWRHFTSTQFKAVTVERLFAQLQSRLLINTAGGVMENAGLCLDRFGVPFIPGSAVKGCARRSALETLRDRANDGESASAIAASLAQIALIFGWGEVEWMAGRKNGPSAPLFSDFEFACGEGGSWLKVRELAAALLLDKLQVQERVHSREPWKNLPHFGGLVSFLPGYPLELDTNISLVSKVPEFAQLELDVLTCHYPKYYGGTKTRSGELEMPVALDTDKPNPVCFPAVASGHVFSFTLLRSRSREIVQPDNISPKAVAPSPESMARKFLLEGLQTFGIGAKTGAGYGWFVDVTDAILGLQEADRQKEATLLLRASLEPDPAFIARLEAMKEPDLRAQINPFATEERFWTQNDERIQFTLLHWLLVVAPGRFETDRTNAKSKLAKAIANLRAKFPQVSPKTP